MSLWLLLSVTMMTTVSYAAFRKLGTEFSDAYLEIIFLDAVCENVDRHTNNYGVLRDVVSGKILSLAPNYDNNLALVSRGYPEPGGSGWTAAGAADRV